MCYYGFGLHLNVGVVARVNLPYNEVLQHRSVFFYFFNVLAWSMYTNWWSKQYTDDVPCIA